MLYWEIGSRIRRDILGDARAEHGNQIVSTLSRQLTAEYGAGFSHQNLFHMIRSIEAWPEQAQMSVLAHHLGWSHFKEILYLDYRSLIIYTMIVSSILYFQRNTTGAAFISSKY